jgi:hypothetical protein
MPSMKRCGRNLIKFFETRVPINEFITQGAKNIELERPR